VKPGRNDSLLWGACFTLALCLHGAGAAALLAKWSDSSDAAANSQVVMIEMAPAAVAPDTTPNDMPPDQVASRAEEPEPEAEPVKPVEKIELPPPEAPKPEVVLPPPPPKIAEKPKEKPKKKSLAAAPSAAPQRADHAAAPMPGALSRDPNAQANWDSQLFSHIARHKNSSVTERGRVQITFSVDRSGGVHNARVLTSSGSSVLDREAVSLVQRSQPLPPPPPDVPGTQILKTLPVAFNMR